MNPWPTKPLAEIATVVRGVTFDKSQVSDEPRENSIPILRAGNIQGSLLTDSDLVYVPDQLLSEEQRMRRGDLAICMSSGSPAIVGKTAHLDSDWRGSVGAFCAIVRFKDNFNHRLGSYWFRSPAFLQWRDINAKGANIQNLRRAELEKLPIPVPPLAEQARIVKLLDEADELRKLRAQADRRTADLIPAIFDDMFGDPVTNPKAWPSGQLKEFGVDIRYGLGQPPEEDPEGVPILRATNVKHGFISEVGLLRVKRQAVPVSRNAFLKADDVLVVRSGVYTGDVARVGEKWSGSVAGYDLVVSPNERLSGEFIASYLLSEFIQERYFNRLKRRAAQSHLNSRQLSETPFICPSLPLQKQFAQCATNIRELQAAQAASRQRLDDLFQSLLHHAFEGNL